MWRLYHHPLCPFSRKVRLLLSEKQLPFWLHELDPWQPSPAYLRLNHTGRTPTLHDPNWGLTIADSRAICEFLEETVPHPALLIGSAEQRAEIRRLVAWADELFFVEVTQPLLRHRLGTLGSTSDPSASIVSEAMRHADALLDRAGSYLDQRKWLAGATWSLADLALAAQVSVADYLGGIDWSGHDQVQTWYSVLKSRRSFQPLLADRVPGIEPPLHYSDVNA
jgi:glutathione S-transferase